MTWLSVTLAGSVVLSLTVRVMFTVISWQGLPPSGTIHWYWLVSPIQALLSFAALVGIWKITTPTFGSRQAVGERARKAARACLWLQVVLSLGDPGLLWSGHMLFPYVTGLGSSLLGLIGWVALLRHCRRLAERVGEPVLAERAHRTARQVVWLLGLALAFTIWMNVDSYLPNRMGSMLAGVSPRAVLREALRWGVFGLHTAFAILMIRLTHEYRTRFLAMAQPGQTPGAEPGTGFDLSPSGT